VDYGTYLDDLVRMSEDYPEDSPLYRLAAALFVGSSHPRDRLMALFTAFFDASGDAQKHPVVIVAGFIANLQQWGMFDHLWKRAHSEAGAELPFHAADFVSACNNPKYADQRNARADYVRLASNPKEADLFIRHLATSIVTCVHCGISSVVPLELYQQINSVLDIRAVVPPYALAARMAIEKLHQWENQFMIGEPAEYIFESGDFEQGKFTQLMIDEGQQVPIYKPKKEFCGLQASDFYAWEQFNAFTKHGREDYAPRESGSRLIWGVPKLTVTTTLDKLIYLCEKKGIKPR